MALRDMEELVAQIVRTDARDYMAEALRCYNAEAFRAEMEAASPAYHRDDPLIALHGGSYAAAGHPHE